MMVNCGSRIVSGTDRKVKERQEEAGTRNASRPSSELRRRALREPRASPASFLEEGDPIGLVCVRAKRSWFDLPRRRSEEHTSELQSRPHLVCRLLLEKKK